MAKEKKPVHKVQMTEGKREIIRQLLNENEKKTSAPILLNQSSSIFFIQAAVAIDIIV